MNQMEYTETFLNDQREFLNDLIAFREPIEKLKERDKLGFVWDDQPEGLYLATLTRQDIISVLERFLDHELSAKDIYQWAEALDCRETIDEEPGFRSLIGSTISAITIDHADGSPLIASYAQEIIHELRAAKFNPEDV